MLFVPPFNMLRSTSPFSLDDAFARGGVGKCVFVLDERYRGFQGDEEAKLLLLFGRHE